MTEMTWETAAEWDGAASESGVVHESTANTDHNDATIVKMGHRAASPYRSADLLQYFPLHEDSGTTAVDFSGNNRDGTVNGPTVNSGSFLGTTGYQFNDNTDKVVCGSDFYEGASLSGSVWLNSDSLANASQTGPFSADCMNIWAAAESGPDDNLRFAVLANGAIGLHIDAGGGNETVESGSGYITENTIYHAGFSYNASNGDIVLYVDGTQVGSGTITSGGPVTTDAGEPTLLIGRQGYNTTQSFSGHLYDARLYNVVLSSSDFSYLADVGQQTSTLITAEKLS